MLRWERPLTIRRAPAHAEDLARQGGLVDNGAMRDAMEQAGRDQAERERLERPQFGQGAGVRLRPAEQGGLFEEGPQQESLFARRAAPGEVPPVRRKIAEAQQILHDQTKGRAIKKGCAGSGATPSSGDGVAQGDPAAACQTEQRSGYDDDTALADADLMKAFPEMKTHPEKLTLIKAISAVTSSNHEPHRESNQAAYIYDRYRNSKDGRIPLSRSSNVKWVGNGATVALDKLNRLLAHFGGETPFAGEKKLDEFLRTKHSADAIRQFGRKLGYSNSAILEWLDKRDEMLGSAVLGPKFSRYFDGITGLSDKGTAIDLWMARVHYRQLGRLIEGGVAAEEPRLPADRRLFMGT
jgi:hypothetical protein